MFQEDDSLMPFLICPCKVSCSNHFHSSSAKGERIVRSAPTMQTKPGGLMPLISSYQKKKKFCYSSIAKANCFTRKEPKPAATKKPKLNPSNQ